MTTSSPMTSEETRAGENVFHIVSN
jgi:hypothetical protein